MRKALAVTAVALLLGGATAGSALSRAYPHVGGYKHVNAHGLVQ